MYLTHKCCSRTLYWGAQIMSGTIMNRPLKSTMAQATKLTKAGKLDEAVTVILSGLLTKPGAGISASPIFEGARMLITHRATEEQNAFDGTTFKEVFRPKPERMHGVRPKPAGSFTSHNYSDSTGQRDYKLFIPDAVPARALPLIVMLHGCTQDPDDFAAGTRMNELAEEYGFVVAYPSQPRSANPSRCWNWFNPKDQVRDNGEPALIAGITRDVMAKHEIDARRVYITGLSAGGAAAAIMAETYPDLYAAVGVHSGLACGAARDMMSAFNAMNQGGVAKARQSSKAPPLPMIVFHGDKDTTVHPSNADCLIGQMAPETLKIESTGTSSDGTPFTLTIYFDDDNHSIVENWAVHGRGHAWFGGSKAGSFTDPHGPDASRQMVRFFLEHPRSGIVPSADEWVEG
jgi:poly(hydroxyalkanoate) depolymerase family esterase